MFRLIRKLLFFINGIYGIFKFVRQNVQKKSNKDSTQLKQTKSLMKATGETTVRVIKTEGNRIKIIKQIQCHRKI